MLGAARAPRKIRGWARGRRGEYGGAIADLEISPRGRFTPNVEKKIAALKAARDHR